MTKNQTQVLHFLKKEFPELLKKKNSLCLSKKSESVLGRIYGLLIKADKSFHSNKKNIQVDDIELHSKYNDVHVDDYIPREIISKIKGYDRHQQLCIVFHNSRRYNIKLLYPITCVSETKGWTQRFFQDAIYKIYLWLYVADKYASKHCSNIMNLHFYFTDHTKQLGKSDLEPLDMIHVNTAFTSSCSKETDIYLFRHEEWFKVFIHETFHNLGFDFSEMDCSHVDKKLNSLFPLNNTFKLYESYCELWAESLHSLFFLFFKGYNKSEAITKYETVLQYETIHSVFQCVKLLNHYQLTYDQVTNKTCHISKKAREKYRENSPVFSYYVIKTIFLLSWNDCMEWCSNNNDNLFQFSKSPKAQILFAGLIERLYKSDRVLSNISFMENWFKSNKNSGHEQYIMRNMRMTLYG